MVRTRSSNRRSKTKGSKAKGSMAKGSKTKDSKTKDSKTKDSKTKAKAKAKAKIKSKHKEVTYAELKSSTIQTDEYSFPAKNGLWYAAYTDVVVANKKRNLDWLKEKGLLNFSDSMRRPTTRPRKPPAPTQPVRRSTRVTKPVCKMVAQTKTARKTVAQTKTVLVCKTVAQKKTREDRLRRRNRLTSIGEWEDKRVVQRAEAFTKLPKWIYDMEIWLQTIAHGPSQKTLSSKSTECVMASIKCLASGMGIANRSWERGIVFCDGIKVQLSNDVDRLLDQVGEMEIEHGAVSDHNHIRYPLRKMKYYQEYCHKKNMSSKVEDLEYVVAW